MKKLTALNAYVLISLSALSIAGVIFVANKIIKSKCNELEEEKVSQGEIEEDTEEEEDASEVNDL